MRGPLVGGTRDELRPSLEFWPGCRSTAFDRAAEGAFHLTPVVVYVFTIRLDFSVQILQLAFISEIALVVGQSTVFAPILRPELLAHFVRRSPVGQ